MAAAADRRDGERRGRRGFPLHVVLAALFPVLGLYSTSSDYVGFSQLVRPALVLVALALGCWGLAGLAYRDRTRGAILVTLAILLLFTFELRIELIRQWELPGFATSYRQKLFALDALALATAFLVLFRLREDRFLVSRILDATALGLVASALGMLALDWSPGGGAWIPKRAPLELRSPVQPPDIYYFLLDGYARQDVLSDLYGYDNSGFIGRLRELGFEVAGGSYSNYSYTVQSVASALNFDYLDRLIDLPAGERHGRGLLSYRRLIRDSRVAASLAALGYRTVWFATGFEYTENPRADHYWQPKFNLGELELQLWAMTPARMLKRRLTSRPAEVDIHRQRVLFALDNVARVRDLDGPTFTFLHLISPHPPFVFDHRGEPVGAVDLDARSNILIDSPSNMTVTGAHPQRRRTDYRRKYVEQLRYLNERLLATVAGLLKESEVPPIVLVYSDHGPGSLADKPPANRWRTRERFAILSAWHLPSPAGAETASAATDRPSREQLSPVNLFRLVFNTAFGAELELLPDRSYWASYLKPFALEPAVLKEPPPPGGRAGGGPARRIRPAGSRQRETQDRPVRYE